VTRSVYVTGVGRGDGRQAVELGIMELLTRQVDRVGLYRPLVHDTPDRIFELLRSRYRLTQDAETVFGLGYEEAAALQAEQGQGALTARLVDGYLRVAAEYGTVLILGSDFAGTNLPAELGVNARLANECGASVLAVIGGLGQNADSVAAEVRNAYHAYRNLGCDVIAVIANRVDPAQAAAAAEQLRPTGNGTGGTGGTGTGMGRAGGQAAGQDSGHGLDLPVYVLPEEPALSAPTVRQIVETLHAEVLLGDDAGLSRDALDFVFGGAMLPSFLPKLTPGCVVVTPGDRADLIIGAMAAHAAGPPSQGSC